MTKTIKGHFARCFIAGIVAILPVAGLLLTIVYFENQVAGVWLKQQGFYFFGLGMILLAVLIYLIGLSVSSLVGKWIFGKFDSAMDKLPLLGMLYQTIKQLLGYGKGPQGLFKGVVWVTFERPNRRELGLVTKLASPETEGRMGVFIPNAPTPTTGRLVYLQPSEVVEAELTVNEALQLLVSLGSIQPDKTLFSTTDR